MKVKKIGVCLTLFFFAASGAVYPQQTASVTDSSSKMGQTVGLQSAPTPRLAPGGLSVRPDLNPYNIAVSGETGKIEEVFQGSPDSPLIVHIQDAHANYEAQVNVKKIIGELVEKHGFSLIQVEGAVSKLDPDALKPSYLEEANLKLADFLMREGRITGADAYAVEAGESVELYGIEDQLLYLENIRMFKQIYSRQNEVNAYFDAVHDAFDSIGRKLLAPGPLDFTRKTEEFAQDKIDLLDYLLYLNGVAEKASLTPLSDLKEMVHYPNLVRIMRLHAIEKQMDQNALKKEGAALKEEFTKRNLLSKEVDELLSRFEDPQKGAKPRDYFLKLTEAADRGQIEFLSYPQLRMFAEYLIYQDEIDHKAVFSELLRYKSYLEGELFKGESEKKLLEAIDFAGLLEQYFRLEMSREKIARYLEHRASINPSSIATELEALGVQVQVSTKPFGNLEQLDSYMNDLEYFYQLVLKRDEVFIEKIISRMQALGRDKTILVTGGFHKDGMTDHFRKRNLSYVVISPKVGVEQGSENYIKVMLDQDIVVGGAFTGSFAIAILNLQDIALSTTSSNYLKLVLAAATSALALSLHQGSIEEFVRNQNERLPIYIKANGRQIKVEVLKEGTGIVGNLTTVYLKGAISGREHIFKAEIDEAGRFIVTVVKSKGVRFDQNLAKPSNPSSELVVRQRIEGLPEIENVNRFELVPNPALPLDTSEAGELSLEDLPVVLAPRNNIRFNVEAEFFGRLISAPQLVVDRIRAELRQGPLTPEIIEKAFARSEVRIASVSDIDSAGLPKNVSRHLTFLNRASTSEQPQYLAMVINPDHDMATLQLQALRIILTSDKNITVSIYGVEGISNLIRETFQMTFKQLTETFNGRIRIIEKGIESYDEAVSRFGKDVISLSAWQKRLSDRAHIGLLIPAGPAGDEISNTFARMSPETFQLRELSLDNAVIGGDTERMAAVVYNQVRILAKLVGIAADAVLRQIPDLESINPEDGSNRWRIASEAINLLVQAFRWQRQFEIAA